MDIEVYGAESNYWSVLALINLRSSRLWPERALIWNRYVDEEFAGLIALRVRKVGGHASLIVEILGSKRSHHEAGFNVVKRRKISKNEQSDKIV